jgi:hypothetical protein
VALLEVGHPDNGVNIFSCYQNSTTALFTHRSCKRYMKRGNKAIFVY